MKESGGQFKSLNQMFNSLIKRLLFYRSIDPVTKCWNWTGCVNNSGYGQISFNRKVYGTHVIISWICLNYNLKSKLHIIHKCDNRKCFNPLHLSYGSKSDNMQDALNKGRMISRDGEVMKSKHTKNILKYEQKNIEN